MKIADIKVMKPLKEYCNNPEDDRHHGKVKQADEIIFLSGYN